MDESGSTNDPFSGTAVGDLNGDGLSNTIMDAQIASLISLRKTIAGLGFDPANVDLGLVTFDSAAFVVTTSGADLSAEADSDFSGQSIVFDETTDSLDAVLKQRRGGGSTNFDDAMDATIGWFSSIGATVNTLNVVYFLSDGVPTTDSTDYSDEMATLTARFDARVVAVGVGSGSSLPELNKIDNTGGADQVSSADELNATLLGNAFLDAEITAFRIFVDGVQVASIDISDLIETPLGYQIDPQVLAGLTQIAGSSSQIRAEIQFDDGTVLANVHNVSATPVVQDTDTATVTVTVTGENDGPLALDDTASTNEDTAVVIDVLANDTDVDGDTLTVSGITDVVGGSAVLNAGGTITFTPGADFSGTAGFTYTMSDGNGGTDSATATVSVAAVNDPPALVDDTATTAEETPVTLAVLANDSDAEGDTLTITALGSFVGGTAVLNGNGTVTFTPAADFNGTGGFTYTVSDGKGGTATATATVTVDPVNDAPVALDDSATTTSDATVEIVLTGNDTDADGDDLDILSVDSTGLLGSVTVLNGDTIRYDPNGAFEHLGQGETATETFSYVVADGNGGTSTASVTVTVGGVNDAPVATNDTAATDQAQPVTIDVLSNDTDPNGDTLSILSNTDPANGTLLLNTDGTFTYDPNDTFFGTDSFDYTVTDGRGASSTGTVTVTVERNLPAFLPEPIVFFAAENQTRAADLHAIDPEGDAVTYSIIGGADAALFTIDAATGALDFITAPDFESPADLNKDNRYLVRVGMNDGLNDSASTVAINVTDVADTPNRNPVITNSSQSKISVPLLINQKGMIMDLDATDLDGDTLIFRLFGEDAAKFSLDPLSGQLTLPVAQTNPRGSFDGDFIFELDVVVEDGHGGSATLGIDFLLFTAG